MLQDAAFILILSKMHHPIQSRLSITITGSFFAQVGKVNQHSRDQDGGPNRSHIITKIEHKEA